MFNHTVSALTLILAAEKNPKTFVHCRCNRYPVSKVSMLLIHDTARQGQSLAINLKVFATDEGSFALLAQ